MSRSLLHYSGNTLLALTSITILLISFGAYSDTSSLGNSDYFQQQYETNRQISTAQWQDNMNETGYYEGSEAFQKLTESALRYTWKALVRRDPGLDHYTSVVSGRFVARQNGVDYGIRFTTDSVKLRVDYSF